MNNHTSVDLTELVELLAPELAEEEVFDDKVDLDGHTADAARAEVCLSWVAQEVRNLVFVFRFLELLVHDDGDVLIVDVAFYVVSRFMFSSYTYARRNELNFTPGFRLSDFLGLLVAKFAPRPEDFDIVAAHFDNFVLYEKFLE